LKAFAPRRTRLARTLGARRDRRQRHSATRLVHFHDPTLQHVANPHDLVRILDEAVRQPTDMNQCAVRQPNVHEHAEVDHVEHRAAQFHARREVFQFHDAATEHRRRQVFARVASGSSERRQNVAQQQRAHPQLGRERFGFELRHAFGQRHSFDHFFGRRRVAFG